MADDKRQGPALTKPDTPRAIAEKSTKIRPSTEADRDELRGYHRTPMRGVPVPPPMPPGHVPETWDSGYVKTDVSVPMRSRSITSEFDKQIQLNTIEQRAADAKVMIARLREDFGAKLSELTTAIAVLQEQNKTYSEALEEVAQDRRQADADRRQAEAALQQLVTSIGVSHVTRADRTLTTELDILGKGAEVRRTITTKAAVALIGAFTTLVGLAAYWFGQR